MKKRTKILLGICILLILITGGVMMTQKTPFDIFLTHDFTAQAKENTKKMQINFLKKHENEITDYIKKQDPDVDKIEYDWNSFSIGDSGAFTDQLFNIDVNVYNSKGKKFNGGTVGIWVDNINNPVNIKEIGAPEF